MQNALKLILVTAAAVMLAAGNAPAQSDAPYTEGSVWTISMVKTKTGMSDDYLKGLGKTFKVALDEAKKQKVVTDYKIMVGPAATPQDFDILLLIEYPNMAAMDGLRDKQDPIFDKVIGSEDKQRELSIKRLDVREILGAKLMREITLK